jgi:hypothetical protein
MEKIIFVLLVSLLSFSNCNKKSANKSLAPEEAYCVYKDTNNGAVFHSCQTSSEAAQQKCIELRNAGQSCHSTKKSTCSDC